MGGHDEVARYKVSEGHFRDWLHRGLTGCLFAQMPDSIALGLEWKTQTGETCDALGLAHVGTMPVTRRAPYVAIAIWGGPHANPHVKLPPRRVGVASAVTGLPAAKHRQLMKKSDKRVRELLAVPPAEDPEWLRRVAFILPRAAAMNALEALKSEPRRSSTKRAEPPRR